MDTPLGATDVRVAIATLIQAYLEDPQAADQRYHFKTLEVSGVLLGLDPSDPDVARVLVGKQLGSKETPCVCQGGAPLAHAAAAAAVGQPITVRGKFAGLLTMGLILLRCEIVP